MAKSSANPAPAPEGVSSDEANGPKYAAPALDKGLDIIELLTETETGYSLSQIARHLSLNSNQIFRMVVTLEQRGYLIVDDADRYRLSLKLFELSHRHLPLRSLVSTALPLMRECANRTKQSCHLAVFEGGRLVVVAAVDGPERWVFGLKVGVQVGLTDTASGLVMLAFRDETERRRMLNAQKKMEGEAEIDPAALLRQLDEISGCGHALMQSKQIRGVTNIAYPIIGNGEQARAVLTVPYIERIDNVVNPSVDEVRAVLGEIAGYLSRLMA